MKTTALVSLALLAAPFLALAPTAQAATLLVGEGGFPTIQAAVDAASPGDTIVVSEGVYQESVLIATPDITLTGEEGKRETTILDGGLQLQDGVTVVADGVTVKTMTARNFVGNGFIFSHVDGFLLTDLHAQNNADYGLYVIHSTNGAMTYSYADGHGDSGFYLGETDHCNCDVGPGNVGWNNMLGYSGTANSYIRIFNNEFFDNRAGILPNVLPQEFGVDEENGRVYGWQVHTEIFGNYVHDNNNKDAPEIGIWETVHVPVGEGIAIAGGWFNHVHDNVITGNDLWGVGLFWLTTPERGNVIEDNIITGGKYGIWWDEWGEDNCFEGNSITGAEQVSEPAVLPGCSGLAGDLPCPEETVDFAACRASDARAPNAAKDGFLAAQALGNFDADQFGEPTTW